MQRYSERRHFLNDSAEVNQIEILEDDINHIRI